MDQMIRHHQGLLKKALTGNAVFSILSGVTILFAGRWLVKFLGLPDSVSLAVLGFSLIAYAVVLWLSAHRFRIKVADAWIAVVMDAVWVVGSYALIFVVPLSLAGKWTVALVAELVLAFAILQWLGIRKVRRSAQYAQ